MLILGGVGRSPQVQRMSRGADIVVGTPGRICDLMNTRELQLGQVELFVLDEADRMLDLGFIRDIRKVVAALPQRRQSMLFSATMPEEVGKLAESLLREPERVRVAGEEPTPDRIEQHIHFMEGSGKRGKLVELLRDPAMSRVIVFTRTKRGADRVAEQLEAAGIGADAMHGNKSQGARQAALERFRNGRARVLVATDLAARGNRRARDHPCGELRAAERAGELRPPHRPHRAGGGDRHRDLVLRRQRAGLSAGDREAHGREARGDQRHAADRDQAAAARWRPAA